MTENPLNTAALFHLGPVPVSGTVVTTWGLMAALTLVSFLVTRRMKLRPGPVQFAVELAVESIDGLIADTMKAPPDRYRPLIGTLLIFLVVANLCAILPGIEPPTAHIETAAALALIVFASVQFYGVKSHGLGGYLAEFARPTFIMLPLNIVAELTRTFSLMVRLFGNVMSGVFVVGIVLSLSGLLVPIPLMALDALTGLVQAYIFTVLAMVFIGGAVGTSEEAKS
jgi:F-type H+-transporting ATPase subunit a